MDGDGNERRGGERMSGGEHRPDGIVVALDGPAGSGKSSTARALAATLGYRHLDSGAFYRAITLAALRAGIDPERWGGLTHGELDRLEVHGVPHETGYRMTVAGQDVGEAIRGADVNAHVSRMAAVPAVREWLMDALREAGSRGGLVADGRDIGTVVFPRAELKAYLVCAPEERARRRLLERGETDVSDQALREEAARLQGRDEIDSSRAVAPLAQADDAVLVDTTRMSFAEQVETLAQLARERMAGG
jgi:cytidylate kinase